jgi:polyisoprenoid-binding protein YceI
MMKKQIFTFSLLLFSLIALAACSEKVTESEIRPQSDSESSAIVSEESIQYTLKTNESVLRWTASRLASKPHVGTVSLKQGYLSKNKGEFTKGEFVIDMTKIADESNNERFLKHLSNEDFFNVTQFPISTLLITTVKSATEVDRFMVSGNLTIKDQTHPIDFVANVVESENSLTAHANFAIDRTQWGITFDSASLFKQLGDRAIKDEIEFKLDLVFEKTERK